MVESMANTGGASRLTGASAACALPRVTGDRPRRSAESCIPRISERSGFASRGGRHHVVGPGFGAGPAAVGLGLGEDLLLGGGPGADRASGQVVAAGRAVLPAEVDDLQVAPVPGVLGEHLLQVRLHLLHGGAGG